MCVYVCGRVMEGEGGGGGGNERVFTYTRACVCVFTCDRACHSLFTRFFPSTLVLHAVVSSLNCIFQMMSLYVLPLYFTWITIYAKVC